MMNLYESIRSNAFGLREDFDVSERLVSLEDTDLFEELPTENPNICLKSADLNLLTLLQIADCLKDDIQFIHWNVTGDQFYQLHTFTNDLVTKINGDIDFLAESMRQLNVKVPNLGTIECCECYGDRFTNETFSASEAIPFLMNKIDLYCSKLEAFGDCPVHIKNGLDDIDSRWRLDMDYFLRNMNPSDFYTPDKTESSYEYGDYNINITNDGKVRVLDISGDVHEFENEIDAEDYIDSI